MKTVVTAVAEDGTRTTSTFVNDDDTAIMYTLAKLSKGYVVTLRRQNDAAPDIAGRDLIPNTGEFRAMETFLR